MDAIGQVYERANLLIHNHVPDDVIVPVATIGAIGCIIAGLMVSVLGAKLARVVLTLGFGALGVGAGVIISQRADLPTAVATLVGAGCFGLLGYAFHRVWIGVLTGLFMVLAVNSTYGVRTIAPHLPAYEQSHGAMPVAVADKFTTAAPHAQAGCLNPEFTRWLKGFWDYTNENDKGGVRRLALLSGCAGLFGLLLGLFAVRFTLVAVTSLVGTLMISAGAMGLAQRWQPQMYEAVLNHPQSLGIAGGTFLLGSVILQTLLTRPDKAAPAATKS
ncbi:MAG: hypothetical protein V3W34_17055 [Phycisphaerae bacterium]